MITPMQDTINIWRALPEYLLRIVSLQVQLERQLQEQSKWR